MKYLILPLTLLVSSAFADSSNLEGELERIRSKYNLPSLNAAIVLDGGIKEMATVGVRKVGDETKVTTNDKFHLGSCTKSMTATLIAMFVEEGKIKWESTLPEMFPDIEIHEDYKSVTLEMLLTHRSGTYNGIPFYDEVAEEYSQSQTAMQDRAIITKHILKKAPKITPNTVDEYNNTGYVIAAHAIEFITKKSWEELTQEKIFNPLEMKSCGYGAVSSPEETTPSAPWGHYKDNTKDGEIIPFQRDNPEMWGPAGRVHCNFQDWAKYLQIHLDGYHGKDSIIKASSFKKLQAVSEYSQMDYTPGGWFRVKRDWGNGDVFTHTGTNLVNYAWVWLAPEKNAAIMVTTNMGGDETFKGTDETLDKTSDAVDEAVGVLIKKHLR
jgi:CubicO group peptidase (beta-lactamase class C family)